MINVLKVLRCKSLFFCVFALLICLDDLKAQQFRLNGDASQMDCDCFELTPDESSKEGAVWSLEKIDLNNSFDFEFLIYLGDDNSGADGIAFGLQATNLETVVSGSGMGLGAKIQSGEDLSLREPSLGVYLDTYSNSGRSEPSAQSFFDSDDHISLNTFGVVNHTLPTYSDYQLDGPYTLPEMENGNTKTLRIVWEPNASSGKQNIKAYYNGTLEINYTGDVINDVFNGQADVFWGLTGSTGNAYNQHYFCYNEGDIDFTPVLSADTTCVNSIFDFSDFDNIYNEEVGTWSWDFGDGSTQTGTGTTIAVPTHTYTIAGDYTAKLLYDNASGTCPQEQEFEINVSGGAMTIDASSTDICYNESVDITITGTGFTLVTNPSTFSGTLVEGINTVNLTETTQFTVSSGSGSCVVTDDVEITVGAQHTFSLDTPQDVCQGEDVDLSVSNYTLPAFIWQTGSDGVVFGSDVSSGAILSLNESVGTHYVRALQTNGSCTDTSNIVSFEVFATPVISLSATDGSCYYDSTLLTISTGGAAFTFTSEPSVVEPLIEGDNQLLLTDTTKFVITAGTGTCEKKDSITINIIEEENLVIEDVFDNICEGIAETYGAGIRIDGSLTDINSVRWQVSHDNVSFLDTLGTDIYEPITVLNIGDYYFRAIYDREGCSDTSNVEFFDVDNPVNLFLPTDLDICEGDNAVFTIINDGTLSTMTMPDKGISLSSGLNDIYIDEDTDFIITADDGGCLKTDSFEVNYIEGVGLDLSTNQDICEGKEVTLSVTQNSLSNYQWQVSHDGSTFVDTLTSNASFTLVGLSAGSYYFKVTHIHNSCESESNIVSFEVKQLPELSVIADAQVCLGDNATLVLSSTGVLDEDYGGLVQGNNNLSLATDREITFSTELNGCVNQDTVSIAVVLATILELDPISDICTHEEAILNVQQKGLSNYQWQVSHDGVTFVDTLTSVDNYTLSGLNAGNYYFRVVYGSSLCESISDTVSFEVNAIPELTVTADTQICEGEETVVNISTSGVLSSDYTAITFSEGDNLVNLSSDTELAFASELNGCISHDTIEVAVVQSTDLIVDPVSNICIGDEATISVKPTGLSNYQWQVSHDGITFIDTLTSVDNYTLSGLNAGNYYFRVVYGSSSCKSVSDTASFEVKAIPELIVSADAQVCEGEETVVNISTSGVLSSDYTAIIFSEGDNSVNLSSDTELAFASELNGCISHDTIEVKVVQSELIVDPISDICIGGETILSVTPTGLSNYQWQVSHDGTNYHDTLTSESNFQLADLPPNDYYFKVLHTNDGCLYESESINFTVISEPSLSFEAPEYQCIGQESEIVITTSNVFEMVTTPTSSTVIKTGVNSISLDQDTRFDITYGPTECQQKESFSVIVVDPILEITESESGASDDFTIAQGEQFTIDVETNTGAIHWYINNEESIEFLDQTTQSFSVQDNSVVLVSGVLNGCQIEDELTVSVIKELIVPNILTPNGNGDYDVFEIENLISFNPSTVSIYNRWGALIYQTKNGYEPWDGTYKGGASPNGTYYYVIEFHEERETMTGYFTLAK